MTTSTPLVPRAARVEPEAVAVTVVVSTIGVTFSLLRVASGLDHGAYVPALLAFVGLLVLGVVLALTSGLGRRELGLAAPAPIPALVGTGVCAMVLIGSALLTGPVTNAPSAGAVLLGLLFFTAGTAPAEELLFRGVLYGVIERRYGPGVAVVVSALSFALAHVPVYGWSSLGVAVCAGLLFGWLRWWSGSLAVPAAVHVIADMALLWL